MNTLTWHDLQFALLRTPRRLLEHMKTTGWEGQIFVGGGFLRAIVAGETVNDVDVFVASKDAAYNLALSLVCSRIFNQTVVLDEEKLAKIKKQIYETDNAFTLKCFHPTIQIIHRWVFNRPEATADSFDFTCCGAVYWYAAGWKSYCDPRFYPDVAAKRLIYRNPIRNEDAGGSMLRVLKYYQKGYRIPLDSLAQVITRLVGGVELNKTTAPDGKLDVKQFSKVVCGLLREVDPNVDPTHVAHLPSETEGDLEITDEN